MRRERKTRGEERDELEFAHLAGGHLKFSMANRPISADMAVDGNVVWRVNKNHISSLRAQQSRIRTFFNCVCANNAMSAHLPETSRLGRGLGGVGHLKRIIRIWLVARCGQK